MSTHGVKARARHPDPVTFEREQFWVNHILFQICDHPEHGVTFALIAGEATEAKFRRPLFAAHVQRGMAAQMRRLADRLEQLEAKVSPNDIVEER